MCCGQRIDRRSAERTVGWSIGYKRREVLTGEVAIGTDAKNTRKVNFARSATPTWLSSMRVVHLSAQWRHIITHYFCDEHAKLSGRYYMTRAESHLRNRGEKLSLEFPDLQARLKFWSFFEIRYTVRHSCFSWVTACTRIKRSQRDSTIKK